MIMSLDKVKRARTIPRAIRSFRDRYNDLRASGLQDE